MIPQLAALFEKGGPVMWPILAASLIGLGYLFYCLLMLRRSILLPRPLADLAGRLGVPESAGGSRDYAAATDLCTREGGPFAEILLTVLASREASRDEAESLVEAAGRRAAHDLSRGVLVLEVIAGVAPLLGLFGTVTGMYQMFMEIQNSGVKGINSISGGIAEALITTIAGLLVGIPAYVGSVAFGRRVDDLVLSMERVAVSLMARVRS